jgi:hypothetical protein
MISLGRAVKLASQSARRAIDITALAFLSIGTLYATARMGLAPRDPQSGVAVVFAPWTSPQTALTRTVDAGARFVRFGGPGFITVAVADDSGYPDRALASGAWLVVDPQILAACLPPFAVAALNPRVGSQ